jgi:hypothetical protein
MVCRLALLVAFLAMGCGEYPVEREAHAQTVYPFPPTGPCGGDLSGTYPDCVVDQAYGGAVVFRSLSPLSGGSITGTFMDFLNTTKPSYAGAPGLMWASDGTGGGPNDPGLIHVTASGAEDILIPYTLSLYGSGGTQEQLFPYYKQYGTTTGAGSVVLDVKVTNTCVYYVVVVGRLVSLNFLTGFYNPSSAGYPQDSFSKKLLVAAVNLSGTTRAVGTGVVTLDSSIDPSQTGSSLAVTYSGNNIVLTATAPSNQGVIDWVLIAKGICN